MSSHNGGTQADHLLRSSARTPCHQEGLRPHGRDQAEILVATDEPQQTTYALESLPGVGKVTTIESRELSAGLGDIEPDLVVLALNGPLDVLPTLYELLNPDLTRRDILVAMRAGHPDLPRVLGRLGVEWCPVRPGDVSALHRRVRGWLCSRTAYRPLPTGPSEPGSATTAGLVATVVRQAPTALSAADVAAKCGFSVVTSRRYLKKLVSEGRAAVDIEYRHVGRPISMYRWAT